VTQGAAHDTSTSAPMTSIVRIAVIVVTLALFLGSTMNVLVGERDLAVLFALATPLGISAWGFARAGYNEPALVLLCCVLTTVVTLVLILNPLGVHDVAITGYGGIILVGALLLSRKAFVALAVIIVFAASTAFLMDLHGLSRSLIASYTTWAQFAEFLVIVGVFAVLGRSGAEILFGSLGDAHRASVDDPVTGLLNRYGFLIQAANRLKASRGQPKCSVLVLADIDGFRRVNTVIGYRAADGVLKEASQRLTNAAGAQHLRGRIGDDEFAVLAVDLDNDESADEFARSMHRALNFDFLGVTLRTSVGYARAPRDANGIEALMLAAEGSLTSAKDHPVETDRFAGPADRI
jgi:diguanylate cyclase (GGDEF)-like protein